MDALLTTTEAARQLGLSRWRVFRFIRDGRIPAQKIGDRWLIAQGDLDAFSAQERKPGRPSPHVVHCGREDHSAHAMSELR